MKLATKLGVSRLAVEMDNVGVSQKLQSEGLDCLLYGPPIEDIKRMLCRFEAFQINVVHRSDNEVIHSLTKANRRDHLVVTWFSVPLFFSVLIVERIS